MDVKELEREFKILAQPNDETCGPTCLHAVYNYYQDDLDLEQIISEVNMLKDGGTLAVMLGNHALKRGYDVIIYTYNLHVFDPSWFESETNISDKLLKQSQYKNDPKLKQATDAYLKFLKLGGQIKFAELKPKLLKKILKKGHPILSGLSATYLYKSPREISETNSYDDIKGEPSGHFVVVFDYNEKLKNFSIADPLKPNPMLDEVQHYRVSAQGLVNSILLGMITYDANLLIIQPKLNA